MLILDPICNCLWSRRAEEILLGLAGAGERYAQRYAQRCSEHDDDATIQQNLQ